MSPVVRAIDVGYGNTKFTSLETSSDIQCGVFPSLAPQASVGPDLAAGLMQRRNTVLVEVGGAEFFKDVLAAKFPQHEIITTSDPVFANVRGFQRAGQQFADHLTRRS